MHEDSPHGRKSLMRPISHATWIKFLTHEFEEQYIQTSAYAANVNKPVHGLLQNLHAPQVSFILQSRRGTIGYSGFCEWGICFKQVNIPSVVRDGALCLFPDDLLSISCSYLESPSL